MNDFLRVQRCVVWVWFVLTAGILSYFLCLKLSDPRSMPFKHIEVLTASNYISSQDVKQKVESNMDGGFFSLDINALKKNLMMLPWVKDIAIKRHWPGTLIVQVTGERPIARWGKAVVNAEGNRFYPQQKSIPQTLPLLMGPESQHVKIIHLFQRFDDMLSILDLHIKTLQLNSRLSWTVWLNNGVEIRMGREAVESRFSQFLKLYPKLVGNRATHVAYVDLRYPNGFAIRWK